MGCWPDCACGASLRACINSCTIDHTFYIHFFLDDFFLHFHSIKPKTRVEILYDFHFGNEGASIHPWTETIQSCPVLGAGTSCSANTPITSTRRILEDSNCKRGWEAEGQTDGVKFRQVTGFKGYRAWEDARISSIVFGSAWPSSLVQAVNEWLHNASHVGLRSDMSRSSSGWFNLHQSSHCNISYMI